jgi:hypothetical protein
MLVTPLVEKEAEIKHFFSDGVYVKQMQIGAGRAVLTHKHKYTHVSILASGTVRVFANGVTREYTSPACITIEAGVKHGVVALEDSVWFCIHATTETDVDSIDEVLIDS